MSVVAISEDKFKTLADLVRDQIETDPFEYDGHQWAAQPMACWAAKLGVCERQARRIIKASGLNTDRTTKDRKQVCLLRDGPKGYSLKQQAKLLTVILEKHIGRAHKPYEFGLCYGFVEVWGETAPEIFKAVLTYPVPFVICARGDPGYKAYRFIGTLDSYLRFLRRFAHVAPAFYADVKAGALGLGASAKTKIDATPYWQAMSVSSTSMN